MSKRLTDTGERLTFASCTIANNDVAIKNDWGGTNYQLIGYSFDYNHSQTIYMTAGQTSLTNCHIETGNSNTMYPDPLLLASDNGDMITMHGGVIALGNNSSPVRNYIANSSPNTISGGVYLRDIFLYNLATTTGNFASGSGNFQTSGLSTYESTGFGALGAKPLLADGGFEESTIVDEWFVSRASSAVTARLT